jgi:hypothetical protein
MEISISEVDHQKIDHLLVVLPQVGNQFFLLVLMKAGELLLALLELAIELAGEILDLLGICLHFDGDDGNLILLEELLGVGCRVGVEVSEVVGGVGLLGAVESVELFGEAGDADVRPDEEGLGRELSQGLILYFPYEQVLLDVY